MSKPTVSAASGAMPAEGHKTRRALLRLFGAAPALAILPAGSALALAAMASPIHPDATLFAMGPAIEAADREFNAALDALAAAEESIRQGAGRARASEADSRPKSGRRSTCFALPPGCGRARGLPPRARPIIKRNQPRSRRPNA